MSRTLRDAFVVLDGQRLTCLCAGSLKKHGTRGDRYAAHRKTDGYKTDLNTARVCTQALADLVYRDDTMSRLVLSGIPQCKYGHRTKTKLKVSCGASQRPPIFAGGEL